MRNSILILGAGRSAGFLLHTLYSYVPQLRICIADASSKTLDMHKSRMPLFEYQHIEILSTDSLRNLVQEFNLVVSLLPPAAHVTVAKVCIQQKAHLITASYVSEAMKDLDDVAQKEKILLLNECGLDPGIDHVTALSTLQYIKKIGAEIHRFESHCGGLMLDGFDANQWRYKIAWNPSNIVQAGKMGAKFISKGNTQTLLHQEVFTQASTIDVEPYGTFETYANRDSTIYKSLYQLPNIEYLYRGTLRKKGFCQQWALLVEANLHSTERQTNLKSSGTTETWLEAQTEIRNQKTILSLLGNVEYSLAPEINISNAAILEQILLKTMEMKATDLDWVLMHHVFEYRFKGSMHRRTGTLSIKRRPNQDTAMSIGVGLPIAALLLSFLEQGVPAYGVHIPNRTCFMEPILKYMKKEGIEYLEKEF